MSRLSAKRPPVLLLAVVGSLLLHLLAIFGHDIDLRPSPNLVPLDVTLVRTAPEAKLGPRPQADRPPKPAQAKPKPEQVPEKPVSEIRDPELQQPKPEAQPEPEKAVAAEPEPETPPLPVAPVAVGSQWPKAGRITFALLMGEQRFEMGRSVHQWVIAADNSYLIQASTEPTGLAAIPWFKPESVYWESKGRLTENGLQPERFIERKSVKGVTALGEINWEAKVVTLGGTHRFTLPERAQDLLSLFYQLGYPGAGDIGTLPIITGKRIDAYQFELLGAEDLALPFGQTWRTQHIRARYGQNEVTEVWTAQDHFGLPVQIRLVDRKGVVYYLQATEVLVDQETAAKRPPAGPSGSAVNPPAAPPAGQPAPAGPAANNPPAVDPPAGEKTGSTSGPAGPVADAASQEKPPTERQN